MKYEINLIQKKSFNVFESIVYFFSNYLRYILVITQLVVIGVLFYRFRTDQSIIDLKESIGQKKEIISVTLPLMAEAKRIDMAQSGTQKAIATQNKIQEMIEYSISAFPKDIFLLKMDVSPDAIKMSGNSLDPNQIQLYYNKLKRDQRFAFVDLEDLSKVNQGYLFTLHLSRYKSN